MRYQLDTIHSLIIDTTLHSVRDAKVLIQYSFSLFQLWKLYIKTGERNSSEEESEVIL